MAETGAPVVPLDRPELSTLVGVTDDAQSAQLCVPGRWLCRATHDFDCGCAHAGRCSMSWWSVAACDTRCRRRCRHRMAATRREVLRRNHRLQHIITRVARASAQLTALVPPPPPRRAASCAAPGFRLQCPATAPRACTLRPPAPPGGSSARGSVRVVFAGMARDKGFASVSRTGRTRAQVCSATVVQSQSVSASASSPGAAAAGASPKKWMSGASSCASKRRGEPQRPHDGAGARRADGHSGSAPNPYLPAAGASDIGGASIMPFQAAAESKHGE